MNIEQVIDKLWDDIERLGWRGMRWKKEFYQNQIKELFKKDKAIFEDEQIVGYGRSDEPKMVFECGECHKKFHDRMELYSHYASNHASNKPL